MEIRVYRVTVDGDSELFNSLDSAMAFIAGEMSVGSKIQICLESDMMSARQYAACVDTKDGVKKKSISIHE